jgi:hypothetical protein
MDKNKLKRLADYGVLKARSIRRTEMVCLLRRAVLPIREDITDANENGKLLEERITAERRNQ